MRNKNELNKQKIGKLKQQNLNARQCASKR